MMGVRMKSGLTGDDVVRDIEFELAQGALSRNELGQSIQAVRQYQNKLRSELFQSSGQVSADREALSRLFQVNDMLIAMLQEMASTLESVRFDMRQVAARASQAAATAAAVGAAAPRGATPVGAPAGEQVDASMEGDVSPSESQEEGSHWRPPVDVETAMRSDALRIEPEVRAAGVPVVGGLLRRLRITLHNLVLFYVVKLARKQGTINQTYGDWILHLGQLNQRQQEKIDLLSVQVSALQARLAGGDQAPSE